MKPKLWLVLAAVALVVAAVAGGALYQSTLNPRSYVDKNFTRARSLDDDGARAYTSDSRPSRVSDRIVDKWKPVSQYADGTGVYLRYSDDAIVIKPYRGGSLILLDKANRVYRKYHGRLGSSWGWTSTYGESFRGGGPGEGK